jgi:hypothetical protein
MAKTDFAAGAGPWSVEMTSLDGDPFLDLAVLDNSGSVAVLLGDGTGGFAPKTEFATGSGPRSLAVGDLDDDTVPDLAVANTTSGGLSVLFGDGAGGFGPKTDFATDGVAYAVAIGDMNGDTFADLVAAIGGASQAWVLLGDGQGGFGDHTGFATGSFPTSVAVGDLNGDTRPDVVTTNFVSGNVSVLLNTTGVLTVPTAPTINPNAVAGHQSATVSWTAPIYDGGSAIIGYVVTPYIGLASQGPRYFDSTATTQTVSGLTNGTTYRFRVRAWNAIGVSGFSKASNPVSPAP